jgi:hypothetical protein
VGVTGWRFQDQNGIRQHDSTLLEWLCMASLGKGRLLFVYNHDFHLGKLWSQLHHSRMGRVQGYDYVHTGIICRRVFHGKCNNYLIAKCHDSV